MEPLVNMNLKTGLTPVDEVLVQPFEPAGIVLGQHEQARLGLVEVEVLQSEAPLCFLIRLAPQDQVVALVLNDDPLRAADPVMQQIFISKEQLHTAKPLHDTLPSRHRLDHQHRLGCQIPDFPWGCHQGGHFDVAQGCEQIELEFAGARAIEGRHVEQVPYLLCTAP